MPIMPNLRSVLAQVHRKSRRIGSHRNFSTSSPPDVKVAGVIAGVKIQLTFIKSFVIGTGVFGYSELYRFYKYRPTLERRLEEEKLLLQRRE